eukprot:TRINITY_DN24438_c0_g1_i12.p2 TRINITY_DN24438_c0_g1~~TRINITY_DN24438_c0_g1_i12.p2  ORF type:complete len:209 (+),score=61.98 TRINITY_DN24438_c0_g1_i12:55-627(+)
MLRSLVGSEMCIRDRYCCSVVLAAQLSVVALSLTRWKLAPGDTMRLPGSNIQLEGLSAEPKVLLAPALLSASEGEGLIALAKLSGMQEAETGTEVQGYQLSTVLTPHPHPRPSHCSVHRHRHHHRHRHRHPHPQREAIQDQLAPQHVASLDPALERSRRQALRGGCQPGGGQRWDPGGTIRPWRFLQAAL